MTTIAIIGAGPGLGNATARRFAAEGFNVALISRTQENVDALASAVAGDFPDIAARGFAADVGDRKALTDALTAAAAELGEISVLQYSPIPRPEFLQSVTETSVDDLATATAFSVLGLGAALETVLPRMRATGAGTILLVNGSSAATPNRKVAGTSVAFAGESAYGQMLHDALADEGVHVGQLIIPGAIGGGDPLYEPKALADRLWTIHVEPGDFRTTVSADA
ncbi:SDR family NAD(P)-dependent oxidoreductase [Microbacterium sp. ISL-103]|nr:SDR family NAD(P)-dependent oxidoreductase [Microbacterium sp. ISL-103]